LLDDPRVKMELADVYHLIAQCPVAHYDAIMLDVDNGPVALVKDGNARLYDDFGFAVIRRALKPGGRVAFWSASPDKAFSERLGAAGFKVEVVAAKAYPLAKRPTHTIFAGDKKTSAQMQRPSGPSRPSRGRR
jgi:spermidine synthase